MNGVTHVPFFRPSVGEAEIAEVVEAMRSGWLTTGPRAKAFEAAFAEYVDAAPEQCLAVNSATAAMHLALDAIGIGPGDEVICPTLTFTATAEVVAYMGAKPVLVDIDAATLNLDPDRVKAAVTPRTRAIMPVHFAGMSCDLASIGTIAERHGFTVVEDAAHALPTRFEGRLIGSYPTTATAFSFYANKTITTGEGGMLVSRDGPLIAKARKMRLHGIDRDVFNRFTDHRASWRYDVVAPGYKYNMTDLAAGIGLHQLARADVFHATRLRLTERYDAGLAGLPLVLPPRPSRPAEHSWHLYVVQATADSPLDRDDLFAALSEAGIGCSVHYTPLHKLTYWRETLGTRENDFPKANAYFGRCLTLPLFMAMTDLEQDYVIATLQRLLSG